jgi:hypothetical protein
MKNLKKNKVCLTRENIKKKMRMRKIIYRKDRKIIDCNFITSKLNFNFKSLRMDNKTPLITARNEAGSGVTRMINTQDLT